MPNVNAVLGSFLILAACSGGCVDSSTALDDLPDVVPRRGALAVHREWFCTVREGELYCFGGLEDGLLNFGLGDRGRRIEGLSEVVAVSTSKDVVCALDVRGDTWCFGENEAAQLGCCVIPDQIGLLDPPESESPLRTLAPPLTWIDAGEHHVCGLDGDGKAICWGLNDVYQLGEPRSAEWFLDLPRPVSAVSGLNALALSSASCGLDAGGRTICWGELFKRNLEPMRLMAPTVLEGLPPFVHLALGPRYGCGVTADEQLCCFGADLAALDMVGFPAERWPANDACYRIEGVDRIVDVSLGGVQDSAPDYADHGCALEPSGRVLCWGKDSAIGIGPFVPPGRPGLAVPSGLPRAVSLKAGVGTTCALTEDRRLFCWGRVSNASWYVPHEIPSPE